MTAFAIFVNGKLKQTVAISADGALVANVNWKRLQQMGGDCCYLTLFGIDSQSNEFVNWPVEDLRVGDEVLIKVLADTVGDAPESKRKITDDDQKSGKWTSTPRKGRHKRGGHKRGQVGSVENLPLLAKQSICMHSYRVHVRHQQVAERCLTNSLSCCAAFTQRVFSSIQSKAFIDSPRSPDINRLSAESSIPVSLAIS